jgi:hypothetical protein
MIDMGMRKDDSVNRRRVKRKRAVALAGLSTPPVENAAVEENGLSPVGESVH